MRSFLRIALTISVIAGFIPAAKSYWQSRDSNYNVSVGGGGGGCSIVGAGDTVSSAGTWMGFDAYSAATCGTKVMNVCNVADVACADLSSNASTGALTISSIGGSSCSIVDCTIKTFYDQSGVNACSGPCDATQTTIALRAILVVDCSAQGVVGPCAKFPVNSIYPPKITSIPTGLGSQPVTMTGAARRNTTAYGGSNAFTVSYCYSGLFFFSANTISQYAGSSVENVTYNDGAFRAVVGIQNGGSSNVVVDGSSTNTNPGSNSCSDGGSNGQSMTLGNGDQITYWREAGIWAAAFNATQYGNMNSNIHSRGGF